MNLPKYPLYNEETIIHLLDECKAWEEERQDYLEEYITIIVNYQKILNIKLCKWFFVHNVHSFFIKQKQTNSLLQRSFKNCIELIVQLGHLKKCSSHEEYSTYNDKSWLIIVGSVNLKMILNNIIFSIQTHLPMKLTL